MIVGIEAARRYSSDWHDQAKELYEIGLSLPDIAKTVDRARGTVKALVTKRGWRRQPERYHEGVLRLALEGEEFRQVGGNSWVSSLGRVIGMTKNQPGVVVKLGRDKDGYLRVGANMRSWQGSRHVHRMVLEAFVGPCPSGMTAAHLDGTVDNNRPYNLRWVSHKENCSHKRRHGTLLSGENHPRSKISEAQASEAKRLLATGLRHSDIAESLSVPVSVIHDISRGRTWRNS